MTKGSIKKILNQEIVHFYDGINIISSKHLRVRFKRDKHLTQFRLPFEPIDIFGFSRILRRLLRLDKCNIFPIDPDFKNS